MFCCYSLILLWSEKVLDKIFIFFQILLPSMWPFLVNVPWHMKKKRYILQLGIKFYKCEVKVTGVSFRSSMFLLSFCLDVSKITDKYVLNSSSMIVAFSLTH